MLDLRNSFADVDGRIYNVVNAHILGIFAQSASTGNVQADYIPEQSDV